MGMAMHIRGGAIRHATLAALALGGACLAAPGFADDDTGSQTIAATVNVPAPNLGCDQAAAQARVTFRVLNVPFEVRRVSVFVDGQGLPESAVEQAWPAVAVTQGLHPGRNLVELIAYGPDNQSIDRKQTVLIGGVEPVSDDIAPAQIECQGGVSADADQQPMDTEQPPDPNQQAGMDPGAGYPPGYQEPPPPGYQEAPPDQPPPEDQAPPDGQPAYVDGPIYSYYPAPVFFGPVYSAGYFAPPPVYYRRAPPLFFYDRGGGRHYRYDPRFRGDPRYHGVYGGYSGGRPDSGHQDWHGGGDHGNDHPAGSGGFGRPVQNGGGAVQAPQQHGTFNTYSPPHYANPGPDRGVQQQPAQRPDLGGVHPQQPNVNPRPAPAPMPSVQPPSRPMPQQPQAINPHLQPQPGAGSAPARQTPRWGNSVQRPQEH